MYLWGLYSKTVSLISNPQQAIFTPAHRQNHPDSQNVENTGRDFFLFFSYLLFLGEQLYQFTLQSGCGPSSLKQNGSTSISKD